MLHHSNQCNNHNKNQCSNNLVNNQLLKMHILT